ncbi:MAG TPA: hypothetical protein VHW26_01045 [Solirubrobacteraceae bacterium]|jgi:hypothetical protein|nr:hypothetical protein [Solirubrobacteraceae bacterium]
MTSHVAIERNIDWHTAEVRDRALTVRLTGEPSKEWRARLEAVLARLDQPGNPWGRVHAKKRRIKVADVRDGYEPDLRHFLEAAILQTNADFAADSPAAADERSEDDQRMTDAFRASADSPADA